MLGARSGLFEWILAVLACAACAVFAIVGAAQSSPAGRRPVVASAAPIATSAPVHVAPVTTAPAVRTPKPAQAKVAVDLGKMGAVTLLHRTTIRSAASATSSAVSVAKGITLPIDGIKGNWVHVMTPCELGGWIRASDAALIAAGGPTSSFGQAVFVIDPGHGGSESGALAPDGVQEQDVNLAIARRLAKQLKGSRVYLTRTGRYNVGLRFRALLASKLGANAFLSMHENSGPVIPALGPGTQTWHQARSPASAKLAAILYRNLYTTLSRYKVPWVSALKIGSLTRLNEKGADYYAVLRESTVPAVIVESLFINNLAEEKLLKRADVQNAIAQATAKSIKQFVMEGGAAKVAPYPVKMDNSGGLPANCRDPR